MRFPEKGPLEYGVFSYRRHNEDQVYTYHEIELEDALFSFPHHPWGNMHDRIYILADTAEGREFQETIEDYYTISFESFLERSDLADFYHELEDGYIPKQDRTDLKQLIDQELTYLDSDGNSYSIYDEDSNDDGEGRDYYLRS